MAKLQHTEEENSMGYGLCFILIFAYIGLLITCLVIKTLSIFLTRPLIIPMTQTIRMFRYVMSIAHLRLQDALIQTDSRRNIIFRHS
ncbi:TPA_asm: P6 [Chrysanthemum betacytorhabdovirus 1]|nr:TPA_asm: P6 [Chrysanthemum betacytorhabdovirus 1]